MTTASQTIRRLKKYARISASDAALAAIEELGTYRTRRAIRALASLMKLADERGHAAVDALIAIGIDVEDEMLRCLESHDEDQAWRAQQVLSTVNGAEVAA
jgi:HEAT repeat protein